MPAKLTTDERLERIDTRFDEMHIQFDKLTAIVVKGFDRIDQELTKKATKEDMNRL